MENPSNQVSVWHLLAEIMLQGAIFQPIRALVQGLGDARATDQEVTLANARTTRWSPGVPQAACGAEFDQGVTNVEVLCDAEIPGSR